MPRIEYGAQNIGLRTVLAPWQTAIAALGPISGSNPLFLGRAVVDWAVEVPVLVRYALVALWCTLAAPAIFRLLLGRDTAVAAEPPSSPLADETSTAA